MCVYFFKYRKDKIKDKKLIITSINNIVIK